MMADTQHFCLRWNNYQSSITSAFENLRDDEDFVDVTLACDGKSLKAHRVVLSACSPYFRELLKSTPCKHPVIVLQDVAFADLHALVEFIYHGEVNVHQRNLSSFLKTAEVLRVSGLTQQADDRDELPGQSMLRGNMQHGFTDKMVEDALFTSPPSPPPPLASGGGATVNQLLRRAAAAALASSNRRERHNSAEPQSDSSEQSQSPASAPSKRARTSATLDATNSHHNNGDSAGATSVNQSTPTDFSTTFASTKAVRKTEPSEGNNADRDRDSSPSPTAGLLDGVKSEPVEMLCSADAENSNDSVEAMADLGIGSHQQSSLSAGDQEDHDSIQGHPNTGFLSSAPESKLFGSVTSGGSFNFSMAALSADHSGLSGIANQTLQGNADGSAGTSSQAVLPMCYQNPTIEAGVHFPPDGTGMDYNVSGLRSRLYDSNLGMVDEIIEKLRESSTESEQTNSGRPYCAVCRKTFSRGWSLQRHIEDVHWQGGERIFTCDLCQRTYGTRSSLISHRSQTHRNNPL